MQQYVFLVHGMGKFPAGGGGDGGDMEKSLIAALKHYAPYATMKDDEIKAKCFKFISITYDSVFEGYRERWLKDASATRTALEGASRDLGKIFDWFAESLKKDSGFESFFWDNMLDVLLWYTLPHARMAVVAMVNKQLSKEIPKMYKEHSESKAHIIAHGLGTSVIHDSVIALRYLPKKEKEQEAFRPEVHTWRTIAMISNMSRLLRAWFWIDPRRPLGDFHEYDSVLNPYRDDTICKQYRNYYHKADPFSMPRPFQPIWPSNRFRSVETERYSDLKLVHDFGHYMANPHIHLDLIRLISNDSTIGTREEQENVLNEFIGKFPKIAGGEYDRFRSALTGGPDRLDAVELAKFLYDVYKELK